MDVAKLLTAKASLGVLLLGSLFAAPVRGASKGWIVRLKKDRDAASRGYATAGTIQQSRDKLRSFRDSRLSRKKSLLLPRLDLVVTEDLSPGEVADLRDDPEVAYVEQDVEWKTQATSVGEASTWPSSFAQAPWLKDTMGFVSDSPDPDVTPTTHLHTVVAVIDTGSRVDHPFLSAALETNDAEYGGTANVDDDGNGFVDDIYGANAITRRGSGTESYSSHGTHVAGIVKTIRDHAIGEFPQAANVTILPVRFIGDDGSGSTATAILALEYALARGARVVNASWGAKGNSAYSQALYEAFASLYSQDVFISVAAGNADSQGANNNDTTPFFPANYNIPSLLSVGSATPYYNSATGRLVSLDISPFSNFGLNTVQIAAPGDYADGRGGASGILSAYSGFGAWGNLYIKKQGTSMAAPVISGIAGVMRAVNPELTAYETKDLLLKSARIHPALSKIQSSGLAHARDAIMLAKNTISQGLRPKLPAVSVRQTQAATPEEHRSGCGTVTPVGRGDGPFNGNSLGLVSGLYALWAFSKRLRKKIRASKT
jgi:subtilisin family serine protease